MRYLTVIGVVFVIAIVVAMGIRLSSETLGNLAFTALGIIGGVCGAVPVSIVLVWALVRRTSGGPQTPQPQTQQYPPVVVIGGPGQGFPNLPIAPPAYGSLPAPQREFKVIPDDGDWEEIG